MRPKLSVITPSFNQGEYLEQTIKSVLGQGYPNLEYVVVDGGSRDGTVEILRRYEKQLAWWVSEPDEGQSDAINKGIEGTTGEIVAYLNSDDYYLPGAFERAIDVFDRTDAMCVAGAVLDLDDRGHLTDMGVWRPEPPERYEDFPPGRHWWLIAPFYLPQSSVFWRREVFERNGLFRRDMRYVFDGEMMCRLALAGEKLALVPGEALSVRREHADQKSSDPEPTRRQIDRFPELLRNKLRPTERIRLDLVLALRRRGFYETLEKIRHRGLGQWVIDQYVDPVLRIAGDLLGRLPTWIRPPIRNRDRNA
jgi:glycosyltransferase involved in cell wall biosynthesis